MRSLRPSLLGILVAAAVAAAPVQVNAEYRSVDVESLRITIDSDWGSRNAPGYLPVRFDITNFGEARTIEIVSRGTRFFRRARGYGSGTHEARRAMRLARGDRVQFTFSVPISGDHENLGFEIREDDRTLERFHFSGFQARVAPADASALIVADPSTSFGRVASGWPRASVATSPGAPTLSAAASPPMDFVLSPARLPTDWLGFTSVRAVLIGAAEWGQLSEDQQQALMTWTACGGDLFFVDGDLRALFPAGQALPSPLADRPVRAYFFGRVHLPGSSSIASTGLADVLKSAETLQDANWALPANSARDWGTITARGFRLPIPGVEGVPARAYLAILIVFSLLIGPVNFWFFRRRRQQVLVVLTCPMISLLFIVLLAGYVLAAEGFGVRGRAVTFTMLDQARKQASTRASVSLYAAGMTPSGGLRFDRDLAIFPIGPEGTGSTDRLELDLTDSQRFSVGAIQARSPSNLEQIGFRAARERVSFASEAGGLTVVNGLGATITTLLYRTPEGVYHLPAPLAEGEKKPLKLGAMQASAVVPSGLPQSPRLAHLLENQPVGSYLAVLARSPFWDPGVRGVLEAGSFHVVLGWPEGQP